MILDTLRFTVPLPSSCFGLRGAHVHRLTLLFCRVGGWLHPTFYHTHATPRLSLSAPSAACAAVRSPAAHAFCSSLPPFSFSVVPACRAAAATKYLAYLYLCCTCPCNSATTFPFSITSLFSIPPPAIHITGRRSWCGWVANGVAGRRGRRRVSRVMVGATDGGAGGGGRNRRGGRRFGGRRQCGIKRRSRGRKLEGVCWLSARRIASRCGQCIFVNLWLRCSHLNTLQRVSAATGRCANDVRPTCSLICLVVTYGLS